MLIVKVKDGEKIERALKRLKRKYRDTKTLQILRDNKYYTKPSIAKRKQLQKAAYIQHLRDQEDI
ncbi:30S ribosomal protein S21 [Mesonia sediminis]|uniref:Small ribosomal subunit protein bS21 n=1 Tax=Mesonia sediminis TaxID=1703946 RepID=A0ABW5SAB9_9FLAO|nr:30S ribosomal protein S21 [Mesonia sp. HuA40]TXK73972.1 30S ribosomal protein S21 [Mesonia sp. HuA40]